MSRLQKLQRRDPYRASTMKIHSTYTSMLPNSMTDYNDLLSKHPKSVRLYHPAFPHKLLNSLTLQDIEEIQNAAKATNAVLTTDPYERYYKTLPWSTFPEVKVNLEESSTVLSWNEIERTFDASRYRGIIVW